MKFPGLLFLFTLLLLFSCRSKDNSTESPIIPGTLLQVKAFDYYPSGSGIEFIKDKFYMIGDDARYLLVLDTNLHGGDSLILYSGDSKRMFKAIKADLESISSYSHGEKEAIILTGSGSEDPYRDDIWWITTDLQNSDTIRDHSVYEKLHSLGITDLNIEGSCEFHSKWIFGNRGNETNRKNFLFVFMDTPFTQSYDSIIINIIKLTNLSDTSFEGLSGLDYSDSTDRLYLTFSSEYSVGPIGKSYLGIINNMSTKDTLEILSPDQVIDLAAIDNKLFNQKVESVCIISEVKGIAKIALVADNDDGKTTLYILDLKL